MRKLFIDKYSSAKAQKVSTFIFRKFQDHMFVEILKEPELQQQAEQYLNDRLKVSETEYEKARRQLETTDWYNVYYKIQRPEVERFVNIQISGTIRRLRQLKILK